MATTISNLVAYSWQLELGDPVSAGIFDKLPGNLTPPGAQPKYLSEWVTQTAAAGQLQDVYNLTPKLPLIGSAGGSVTLKLDTNGNGKFDFNYTDANANGKYDTGEVITEILEEVQIYYNGVDLAASGNQIQGYAHYDMASKTWKVGAGNGQAIVPQPPVVVNPNTNPYDPYNPYNPNVYDPYNPYNQYSQYGAPLPDWSLLGGQQWQPQWQPQQQQWPVYVPVYVPVYQSQPDYYCYTPQPCYQKPSYHCTPGATNGWKPYHWC
jgi:hypothetical protein